MAAESRGDLASRHGRIGRIAEAYSWSYRSDNPICTRTDQTWGVWLHEAEDGARYVVLPDGTTIDTINRWPHTVQGQPAVRLSSE